MKGEKEKAAESFLVKNEVDFEEECLGERQGVVTQMMRSTL